MNRNNSKPGWGGGANLIFTFKMFYCQLKIITFKRKNA